MKIIWSFYVGILLFLGYGRMFQKIVTDNGGFVSRYGPPIAVTILAIGLCGCLMRKPVTRIWVWKTVFWISAIGSTGLFIFAMYLLFSVGSPIYYMVGLILAGLMLLTAAQRQIYRYAYKSRDVWGQEPNKSLNADASKAGAG